MSCYTAQTGIKNDVMRYNIKKNVIYVMLDNINQGVILEMSC